MGFLDTMLTGASSVLSMATGGRTPIYGEPDGMTREQRQKVLGGAAATIKAKPGELVVEATRQLAGGVGETAGAIAGGLIEGASKGVPSRGAGVSLGVLAVAGAAFYFYSKRKR